MLARIAHELFWLGRYMARAEHTARMLDGVFMADLQGRPEEAPGVMLTWEALLAIMGTRFDDGDPRTERSRVIRTLTIDPENPASILSCVGSAREGAKTVRDVISAEMWEAVNTFHLELQRQDLSTALRTGPYSTYQFVKRRSALFWGLAERTMLRDEAQAFLSAGGRIEAADMVLRMLRVAVPLVEDADSEGDEDEERPEDTVQDGPALALLHAVGGFQAFRRAVQAPPNAGPVARFLLFDTGYPSSVAASVEALHSALAGADAKVNSSPPVLRLGRLAADLEFRRRAPESGTELAATLRQVQQELQLVDGDIADRYFQGATSAERAIVAAA